MFPLVLMLRILTPGSCKTSTSTMVRDDLIENCVVSLIRTLSEDETNMHRHARNNAHNAVALAKKRAQDFDTQAALERKTNEALKLAKRQAHIRADEDVETPGGSGTLLVDRMYMCNPHSPYQTDLS